MSEKEREFIYELCSALTKKQREKLLDMIAQVMEAAYRRGVQQTLHLMKENAIDEWITNDDGCAYRFDKSLKRSIGIEGKFNTSSIDRLLMESHNLDILRCGISCKDLDPL